jgi:endonuclease/exonuclease/phosphatase (EEP) superfamily protein YafD
VRVCSLHLFPFHEFGVEEDDGHVAAMWRELWGHLRDTGGQRPAILAGDFNQVNRQEAARRWGRSGRWSFLLADKVTTDFGLALDDVAVNWRPSDIATEVVPSFSDHHLAIVEIRSPVLRPSLVAASARREA